MITKARLLAALGELIYVEEGMITVLANFSKAVIAVSEEISEENKKEMMKILSKLYKDSAKHKEKVTALIRKVEKGTTDVY